LKILRLDLKKIEQTLIAWLVIIPLISKDDQLTVFINTAYLGYVNGKEIRGFAEASIAYYGKPFKELSETEYF
jgi:membrane peptidoglycan carboxypeptidase